MPAAVTHRIEFNGKKLRIGGTEMNITKYQMLQLGSLGLLFVKDRVGRGIGAEDSRMKPLKRGYAIQKTKAGKGNIRNLTFSGAMLDNLTVRYADENLVKIALTARLQRTKALANERKDSWLMWSDNDAKLIIAAAQDIFKTIVTQVQNRIPYLRRRAA